MKKIGHFIHGEHVETAECFSDIYNPAIGKIQAQLCMGQAKEIDLAVQSALKVFPVWSSMNPQKRIQILFRFKELVEQEMDGLAKLLSSEHGKILNDSIGDIRRGLDVVEFACGIPHLQKGEFTNQAASYIDVYSMRVPLGVVAGITPFNFPAMIPMWMFSIAIATGNCMILKPSEKDPSLPLRLCELMLEAGLPAGVLNLVNGGKEAVNALLEHSSIQAISFVGSSDIAHYVYQKGAKAGKRVQAMGGAKNHAIIMPDADLKQAVKEIIGAAYGSAGERCMALPVIVPVGEQTAQSVREALIPEIQALRIGEPQDQNVDYGPLVSQVHKNRVVDYIDLCEQEGAELLIDGRQFSMQKAGFEKGYYLGPSLFDYVKTDMKSYQEEIFGPVLQILRADDFEQAIHYPSCHQYGNGVTIYTQSGAIAHAFTQQVNVGMIGINVPIPVPVAYHTFGGCKRSAFGDMNQHGMEGVRFYTRIKTVTARWSEREELTGNASFIIPTHR